MGRYNPLIVGDLVVENPVVQGGMGVGISLAGLAGAVAKAGGMGIISAAQIGFRDPEFEKNPQKANLKAIVSELRKAREISGTDLSEHSNGKHRPVLGFNIMVATKNYMDYVRTAVEAGADIIISGAGLPVTLPELTEGAKTKIAPIVSTAKSAMVICKMWDRKFHRIPDLLVIEGPLAGGHLGFSREQLAQYGADTAHVSETYSQDAYDEEIRGIMKVVKTYEDKYETHIPVAVAGGIYTHQDVLHALELGADGVQVATRFVTTEECDAPMCYKQSYIDAKEEDIVITQSPVGMPGRAIRNHFLEQVEERKAKGENAKISHCYQCLEHCNPASIPYCITKALSNAAEGVLDQALLFCGTNASRAEKIETVEAVIKDLAGEPV